MENQEKIDKVLEVLKASVAKFYRKDENLLTNDAHCYYGIAELYLKDEIPNANSFCYRHGMEQACAFRIGHYFCNQFEEAKLGCYGIDMEYNKHINDSKRIRAGKGGGIRPDLIVHKRGNDDDNFLVVEFKYGSKTDTSRDKEKLKELTNKDKEYGYEVGVLVVLNQGSPEYTYFQNGQEVKEMA